MTLAIVESSQDISPNNQETNERTNDARSALIISDLEFMAFDKK